MSNYYTNDMGSLFIQLAGPNTATAWLACVDMGDVTYPKGDVTREYCPDPAGRGTWSFSTRSQGASGELTFDLTIPIGKTSHLLEDMARTGCPVPIYLLQTECGRRDMFLPLGPDEVYRGTTYARARLTNEGRSGLASRNADGSAPVGATQTFSLSCAGGDDWFNLVPTRRTTAADQILADITFCDRSECAGACGPANDPCTDGLFVGASAVGPALADIQQTTDSGVTWTAVAVDPLAAGINAGACCSFYADENTKRWIVTQGETIAAAGEIHYSDSTILVDPGAAWTTVAMGAVNEFFGGIFAADRYNIWMVSDTGAGAAGNIYYSADAGLTWANQQVCGDAMNEIKFARGQTSVGLAVGDQNEIYLCLDGGANAHWNAVTGPAAQAAVDCRSCEILDANRFFVGYEDGELWYTTDGGTTWTERAIENPPAATAILVIDDIEAIDENCIWICGSCTIAAANWGFIERSVDGGTSWECWLPAAATTSDGLTALYACGHNEAFAVGGVATTSMVMDVATS